MPCPTNVVRFAYHVAKHSEDSTPQVIYYDQGVGTGNLVEPPREEDGDEDYRHPVDDECSQSAVHEAPVIGRSN